MMDLHPREQLVLFMRRIYERGLTTTSGGNLSVLDDAGNLWITPGGIDKGGLEPEDIVCVRPDGSREGRHQPSSEYPFHRSVYRLRPEVRAVMHAHPPLTVAFSIAGVRPEPALCPEIHAVCGDVGFAPYDIPGSEALGRKVGAAFAEGYHSVLLENHGVCVVGASLAEAYGRLEQLDFLCRAQNQAVRLGGLCRLPEAVRAACPCYHTPDAEWPGLADDPEEQEARRQLAEMTQRAWRQGLFSSAVGVCAWKLEDGSLLLPVASADRAVMTAADFVRVPAGSRTGTANSLGEWLRRVLERHSEFRAVFAAMPPQLMAYGLSGKPFDPRVIPESYIQLRELPSFEIGSDGAACENLERTFSARYPVVRMTNGWVLTGGATLHEAFDRLEVAEFSARAAIEAGTLGGMQPMTEAQVTDLIRAFRLPES